MKKLSKKKWMGIGTAAVVLAVGCFAVPKVMAGDSAPNVKTSQLYPTEMIDNISIKGTVESVQKNNVYSTAGLSIQNVYVEVGDRVTEGQVLCELDAEDLKLSIAQQKADLDVTQQNSLNQLKNNQRIYNETSSNLNSGTGSQIQNAESSIRTAEVNLENAQRTYDEALKDYNEGTNTQVTSAESNLVNAEMDLDTKKTTLEENKVLYEAGVITQEVYTQSETAYINAENKYNTAVTDLENAKTSMIRSLEQSENTLKSAKISYENALASKQSATVSAKQDLEKAQSNIESAQISMNTDSKVLAIQKLENQLEDSEIKSPINGTVTAVYAKEGATATGLLFVIEDTDRLKVTTYIKEYDITRVKTGMEVTIKTDSTGDAVYEGRLSKVEPTAVKNASGETASTSDVEFAAEVAVVSKETELKVGMNTRLNVILDKKDGVYCVPYDAVTQNESGESAIYTVADDGQGHNIAKRIVVSTGMETDFYVEIISDALSDGLAVINDASIMQDGMRVAVR